MRNPWHLLATGFGSGLSPVADKLQTFALRRNLSDTGKTRAKMAKGHVQRPTVQDYELCFTVPELNRGALDVALGHLGARFTCIGQIVTHTQAAKRLVSTTQSDRIPLNQA
jgi:thiamine monophosphate kinase